MELVVNPAEYGIEQSKLETLIGDLPTIKAERQILSDLYLEVIKMDIDDIATEKAAKELRLKIVKNRTQGIDLWHKNAKEFFLKGGQFIDAIKRAEVAVNLKMESDLEEIEQYRKNKIREEMERLRAARILESSPYAEFIPISIDLGAMSDDEYQKLLVGARLQFDAMQKELEEKRLQEEKEQQRIRLINERELKLRSYWTFVDSEKLKTLGDIDDATFESILQDALTAKKNKDDEYEMIKKANEELEQKRLAEAKKAKDAQEKADKDAAKLKADAAKKEQELKAELERKEQARKEAEAALRKKEQEEEQKRLEEQKMLDEQKRKDDELRKAPIKNQMKVWVDSFSIPEIPIDNDQTKDIIAKFESFKVWSKSVIEKM